MNKDGSDKFPVPEDRVERFMCLVYVLADMCGIDEIEDVSHHVDLLGEAVARHVFEKHHKVSPQRKVHNDRKRFIAIFKSRYQQLMDLEYTKKITPVEAKQMNQVNKALAAEGFTADDYLAWLFEVFLVDNPRFRPPTIKSICAQYFLHSFIDANRELKDAKRRQALDKKVGMDLIGRARVLLRSEISPADQEKMKTTLRRYGDNEDRDIMLPELRMVVEDLEKRYRQ